MGKNTQQCRELPGLLLLVVVRSARYFHSAPISLLHTRRLRHRRYPEPQAEATTLISHLHILEAGDFAPSTKSNQSQDATDTPSGGPGRWPPQRGSRHIFKRLPDLCDRRPYIGRNLRLPIPERHHNISVQPHDRPYQLNSSSTGLEQLSTTVGSSSLGGEP